MTDIQAFCVLAVEDCMLWNLLTDGRRKKRVCEGCVEEYMESKTCPKVSSAPVSCVKIWRLPRSLTTPAAKPFTNPLSVTLAMRLSLIENPTLDWGRGPPSHFTYIGKTQKQYLYANFSAKFPYTFWKKQTPSFVQTTFSVLFFPPNVLNLTNKLKLCIKYLCPCFDLENKGTLKMVLKL